MACISETHFFFSLFRFDAASEPCFAYYQFQRCVITIVSKTCYYDTEVQEASGEKYSVNYNILFNSKHNFQLVCAVYFS